MKHIVSLLSILCFFYSCIEHPFYDIEETLSFAGDNRKELEMFIEHFKDSNKLANEAVLYLISNMKYHKSKDIITTDDDYNIFFYKTDSIVRNLLCGQNYISKEYDSLRSRLGNTFNGFSSPCIKYNINKPDAQMLSSDFLIEHLNNALRVWNTKNYDYKRDFEFFKEFLLPYRTTNEYLNWDGREIYEHIHLPDTGSIYDKIGFYKSYIEKSRWLTKYCKPQDHLGIFDVYVPKFKMDCHNMTNWSCEILRANGVPVVYEFTPLWKDRSSRHFWCVSPDSAGILQPYTAPDNNIREDWDTDIMYVSKVYRRTFEAQPDTPLSIAEDNEFVPELFQTMLLKDQTFRYSQTVTLHIPLNIQVANKLAYLGMFTPNGISIVGWGKVDMRKNEIIYEQVPVNTLFFPVYYDDETLLDIAEPFILYSKELLKDVPLPLTINEQPKNIVEVRIKNREVRSVSNDKIREDLKYVTLQCDTDSLINMHLLRKYPLKRRFEKMRHQLTNSVLLGSDKEKGAYDTLLIFKDPPKPYLQEYAFKNSKKYKYYRFATCDKLPLNIAHIEFLGGYSKRHKLSLPTPLPKFNNINKDVVENIYRIDGKPLKTGKHPEHAFDNDMMTYVGSSSVGMEYDEPVRIERIRLTPRTANNMIVPEHSYMLLYYDKGWKEFEVLYAENEYLDFENVPNATLYWLRDLTEGKEELPFFYYGKKQYFLHVDSLSNFFSINE